jgi:hypothetical protein
MALETAGHYGPSKISDAVAVSRAVDPTYLIPEGNRQLKQSITAPE